MVDVSFDQLHAWLTAFLWPFMRLTGFFMAAPLLGHSAVPNRVKIGLAALAKLFGRSSSVLEMGAGKGCYTAALRRAAWSPRRAFRRSSASSSSPPT